MSERAGKKTSLSRQEGSSAEVADRPSGSSTSVTASPSLKPKGVKLRKNKSRPQMKRLLSAQYKLIYSVDDDINEELEDDEELEDLTKTEKKYLEGYHDALRLLHHHKKSKLTEPGRRAGPIEEDEEEPDRLRLSQILDDVENNTIGLSDDDTDIADETAQQDGDISDNESAKSTSLKETIESLNLKDRQEAINTTHPFGIKIWKPSIYKKNRSVAVRAEEDIHDYDPRRPAGRIYWGVHLTNFIWCLTFGLFLYALCVLGADENYLDEDELDGRSISEFHRWRLQEEGRLFFAPPRRMTNSESKPLLKDHKGRPLRDAYSSLGDDQQGVDAENAVDDNNDGDSPTELDNNDIKVRFFGRGRWSVGRLFFYLFFYGILQPILFVILILGWLFVFTIPMANLISILCDHLRRRPLALHFELEESYYRKVADPKLKKFYKNQSIILCTYRCCGLHYYKYTIDGTNIFFINLLVVVFFVILDFFLLKEALGWEKWYTDSSFLFCGCLFSIVPLAYFIGQAVASISAQSSMGVGAVINAFFSTIVEIFLYCVALNQSKGKLVEGSMIGSILGGVLLLPGLSMCGGALKRKTQRYNPRSAGVSSTMLLFAMVTMFAPSLFYQMYGSYEIRCKSCDASSYSTGAECTTCRFIQPSLTLDKLYLSVLRPFSMIVAVILFVAYVCGLFFTLRTHASLIWATNSHEQAAIQSRKDSLPATPLKSPSIVSIDHIPLLKSRSIELPPKKAAVPTTALQEINKAKILLTPKVSARASPQLQAKDPEFLADTGEEEGGHDAPNWSNNKSTVILLGATLLYAIIAEILVDNVDAVLSNFPINPKFLGLTVFALVPNTTEFVNAISFAVGGNVALSMEIGSAYALQVVLIQIPSLAVFSVLKGFTNVEQIFSLIFPRWDIIATLISIYLFTYIYAEGKSNYFKGVILILIYVVVLVGFYLDDVVADLDDGFGVSASIFAQLLSR
ncbi:CIC11C00000005571 [Sungouiella intermedia]|uniref:CIC11C00000005571 n=1 Tax=Sungouiella intermedia TaxID=45354 RepID=A0A1L0C028_9ASCO|nr:CIC11C00000005571 [[Candida] intermedia]